MQLEINLDNNEASVQEQSSKDMERARKAQTKRDLKNYEPTWDELWITGYTTHTGKHKKGIFETKITEKDMLKLKEVKGAIEQEELGTHVESFKKFSKSHALNLYQKLQGMRREGILQDMKDNKPDNYHLINTDSGLRYIADCLEHEELLALDTETTGVKWEDRTVGISLSLPIVDMHIYLPYGHITESPQLSRDTVMQALKPHLEREGMKLVLHNSKFDADMLQKDGIHIRDNIYFDTMIAMHVLNENEPSYALKKLANKYGKYFNYHDDSHTFEELFGKDPQSFIEADLTVATIYASKDTELTLKLYQWQKKMMDKQPKLKSVYFDIEQINTHVALEMESAGFAIDFDFAEQYGEELKEQVARMREDLAEAWGDININSSKQLQTLIYDELGLEDVSGKRSVDKHTLKKLATENQSIQTLLDYRDTNKLLSTYIEPLPMKVRKDIEGVKGDYRLHGQFNQTATVTGRWASKEPNLQNLPPRARKIIVAPEGKLLLGIDYSQIEPRTLASMSGDETLQSPYNEGIDLYSTLASKVFDLPYEACLEEDDTTWREQRLDYVNDQGERFYKPALPNHPRKMMKVGLLAVMYGMTARSLMGSLGISYEEAEQFLEDFYTSYPVMSEWMDEQRKIVDAQGYVETMHGRKRRFIGHTKVAKEFKQVHNKIKGLLGREPKSNIWEEGKSLPYKLKLQYFRLNMNYSKVARMSVNAVIQGSASEILKKAMINVYEHLKDKGDQYRIIGSVHDELLFEVPDTITPEEIRELESIMINTTTLDVPIKVDTEVMIRWGEGVPFDEWESAGCGTKVFNEEDK